MQDKYVGDIGDYGKLALLRQLVSSGLSIGIVWCAVDGSREINNDGSLRRYRSYTGKHCLRHCDPDLFDAFKIFEDVRNRSIVNLQNLTSAHAFFSSRIPDTEQQSWSIRAFRAMSDVKLVFFDPDNGISTSVSPSAKHISLDELCRYWGRDQSLLIYHHLSRKKGGHDEEAESVSEILRKNLQGATIEAFRFRRGNSRVFYLAMQPQHRQVLTVAVNTRALEALTVSKKIWAARR
jgi:hypothetical protein